MRLASSGYPSLAFFFASLKAWSSFRVSSALDWSPCSSEPELLVLVCHLFASSSLCSSWSKSAPLMPLPLAWSNTDLASTNLSNLINASIWLYQNCAMLGLASKAVLKNGRASSILPSPTASKPMLWFASGCLGCALRIAAYRRCASCTCPVLCASTPCCRAWLIVSFTIAILALLITF